MLFGSQESSETGTTMKWGEQAGPSPPAPEAPVSPGFSRRFCSTPTVCAAHGWAEAPGLVKRGLPHGWVTPLSRRAAQRGDPPETPHLDLVHTVPAAVGDLQAERRELRVAVFWFCSRA